ncbi:MAG: hypothetical protein ACOC44_12380 [Promethearchaeia archaeon]
MSNLEVKTLPTHICNGCPNKCMFTEKTMEEYNRTMYLVYGCHYPRKFNPERIEDKEKDKKMEQLKHRLQCPRCEVIINGITGYFCSACNKKASYMDLWGLDDIQEAVELYIIQTINEKKAPGDKIEKLPPQFKQKEVFTTEVFENLKTSLQKEEKTIVDTLGPKKARAITVLRAEIKQLFTSYEGRAFTKEYILASVSENINFENSENIAELFSLLVANGHLKETIVDNEITTYMWSEACN